MKILPASFALRIFYCCNFLRTRHHQIEVGLKELKSSMISVSKFLKMKNNQFKGNKIEEEVARKKREMEKMQEAAAKRRREKEKREIAAFKKENDVKINNCFEKYN